MVWDMQWCMCIILTIYSNKYLKITDSVALVVSDGHRDKDTGLCGSTEVNCCGQHACVWREGVDRLMDGDRERSNVDPLRGRVK